MDFKNKKIAVLGLGIEGIDLCQYLAKKKALITGFDIRTEKELAETYQELKKLGLNFSLGENYLKDGLIGFDYIFRSPGVRLDLHQVIEAKKRKIPILSATELFFKNCPGKIIGVTGTKGKGTTATLIWRILKESGKKVFLLGNIGQPPLKVLAKIKETDWVVFELSSFQLQDLSVSPHIAVALFIAAEHLNYHRSFREYIQAKTAIVRFQTKGDFAVLNADNQVSTDFSRLTLARIYHFSRIRKVLGAYVKDSKELILSIGLKEVVLGKTADLKLIGEHNWENIAAASVAAFLAGADIASIRKAVFSFRGLEHRLELVAEIRKVKFYNDSFSTTPETTIAAIRSFKQPTILIAGGSEKGSDFTKLGKEIVSSPVKSLILVGEMAGRIEKAVKKAGFEGQIIRNLSSMKSIIEAAEKIALFGDIILLSPACASFDLFLNYKDRGEQFKRWVLVKSKRNYQ